MDENSIQNIEQSLEPQSNNTELLPTMEFQNLESTKSNITLEPIELSIEEVESNPNNWENKEIILEGYSEYRINKVPEKFTIFFIKSDPNTHAKILVTDYAMSGNLDYKKKMYLGKIRLRGVLGLTENKKPKIYLTKEPEILRDGKVIVIEEETPPYNIVDFTKDASHFVENSADYVDCYGIIEGIVVSLQKEKEYLRINIKTEWNKNGATTLIVSEIPIKISVGKKFKFEGLVRGGWTTKKNDGTVNPIGVIYATKVKEV